MVATGVVGGFDVGLGIIAQFVVLELTDSVVLGALAFSIGFIALTLARSELFTEDFLVPVTTVVARDDVGVIKLVRLWATTLAANLAGGYVFMAIGLGRAAPDRTTPRRGRRALRRGRHRSRVVRQRSPRRVRHTLMTWSSSSSRKGVAVPSEGARQSPRGDRAPPPETFGPFGMAERLNWLKPKKRHRNSSQPLADVVEVVGVALVLGEALGPAAGVCVAPGVPGQERHLRRRQALAGDVVQEEVVQLVGADLVLGALDLGVVGVGVLVGRDQLGGDHGVEDRQQDAVGLGSHCSVRTVQRMRCWMRVFGTPLFTL
jgi:hypothetical protein